MITAPDWNLSFKMICDSND